MSGPTGALKLALLVAPLALAGCEGERGPQFEREGPFAWTGTIAPGKSLRIRELQGGITVKPSADSQVRITTRVAWRRGDPAEDLRFSATPQDGDMLVCVLWSTSDTCTKETYNANIRRGRGTDAKVHFDVEVPEGVRLDLVTISGDIRSASSAPVLARTVNGDVIVVTAVGPVEAKTLNGSVDVRMSSLANTDTVKAETVNGSVYVYLPATVDAALDLSVVNGGVSTTYPIVRTDDGGRRHLRGRIGQGTHPVFAKTINGEVAVRALDAEGRAQP